MLQTFLLKYNSVKVIKNQLIEKPLGGGVFYIKKLIASHCMDLLMIIITFMHGEYIDRSKMKKRNQLKKVFFLATKLGSEQQMNSV